MGGNRRHGERLAAWVTTAMWLTLAVGLGIRILLLQSHPLGEDERQHVHFAWCLTQGEVPYRDFWDNHPPFFQYLLAGLMDKSSAFPGFFIIGRYALLPAWMLTLGLTAWLAFRVAGRAAALAAVVLLAICPAFSWKMAEIRPDVLLAPCVVAAVGFAIEGLRRGSPRGWRFHAASGLALGFGFLFSTKAIISLGVLALVVWISQRIGEQSEGVSTFRRSDREDRKTQGRSPAVLPLLAAFFILPAVWLSLEALRRNAWAAMKMTLLDNAGYPERFFPWRLLSETGVDGWPAILLVLWLYARWERRPLQVEGLNILQRRGSFNDKSRNEDPSDLFSPYQAASSSARRFLALFVVGFAAAYLILVPAPYLQTALPLLPPLAILLGIEWSRFRESSAPASASASLRRARAAAFAIAALLCIIRPVWLQVEHLARGRAQFQRDLDLAWYVHDLTTPEDVIFDGHSIATFRPHALFHPVLVKGVQMRYREGAVSETASDQLRRSRCTLYFEDSRTRGLPESDQIFLRDHFVEVDPELSLHLPGHSFVVAERSAGKAVIDLLTPGFYGFACIDDERGLPLSAWVLRGLDTNRPAAVEDGGATAPRWFERGLAEVSLPECGGHLIFYRFLTGASHGP